MTNLGEAARDALRRYVAEEPLACLYRQPDRAIFLAERAAIVLKVYADGAILRREWAMAWAAGVAGVPITELLGFTDGPPAVIAMRRVVGRPLGADDPTAAREAGRLLARFHRLGASPPFTTGELRWERHILAWAERELQRIGQWGALDADTVTTLRHFTRHAARLAARPIVLFHGDLQPDHILVSDGRVLAFPRFADAQPGDPLLDLAVLTLRDGALIGPLLVGYSQIDDAAETWAILATYRLLRRVSEVPWLLERGFAEEAAENVAAIRALLVGMLRDRE